MFNKIKIKLPLDKSSLRVKKGDFLIEPLQKSRLRPYFGCTKGICGTCVSTITYGLQELPLKQEREILTLQRIGAKENQRLVCQLKPSKPCTIIPQYGDTFKREWIIVKEDGSFVMKWMDTKHSPQDIQATRSSMPKGLLGHASKKG